jgi:glycosyltransferase involved in cell wall biosynthesis
MIKVLHLSTHNEDCGIGKYQEMFLDSMRNEEEIHNEFFELSPNQIKIMNKNDYENAFKLLDKKLKEFDVIHIQQEYSFYWLDELERAINIAKSQGKKSIVTVHTSANVGHTKARLTGLGPRSFLNFAKALISQKRFYKRFVNPMKIADLILVHNEVTKQSLVSRGVPEGIIRKIVIPVPEIDLTPKSTEIKENLKVKQGDVVYATVGFIHRFKGVTEAIKALRYLPENYKLAIVGGLHPGTDDIAIYDKITDLIDKLQLKDRVYITGYVAEDERMNALLRECDACVYPYEREYYSNVSSAALNNAFANHVPVIAYPTESFKEINTKFPVIRLTQTFAYYELARELRKLNVSVAKSDSKKFAQDFSYPVISKELLLIYKNL